MRSTPIVMDGCTLGPGWMPLHGKPGFSFSTGRLDVHGNVEVIVRRDQTPTREAYYAVQYADRHDPPAMVALDLHGLHFADDGSVHSSGPNAKAPDSNQPR